MRLRIFHFLPTRQKLNATKCGVKTFELLFEVPQTGQSIQEWDQVKLAEDSLQKNLKSLQIF